VPSAKRQGDTGRGHGDTGRHWNREKVTEWSGKGEMERAAEHSAVPPFSPRTDRATVRPPGKASVPARSLPSPLPRRGALLEATQGLHPDSASASSSRPRCPADRSAGQRTIPPESSPEARLWRGCAGEPRHSVQRSPPSRPSRRTAARGSRLVMGDVGSKNNLLTEHGIGVSP